MKGPLKVGEVAALLGISASMIRGWERLGIVQPSRTDGSYRLYSENEVSILRRAVYLRRVSGLNAPAILDRLQRERLIHGAASDPEIAQQAIGPRLRKLRLARGESLSNVAKALGLSVGFVSNVERSQSGASVGILHKMAQHYGANVLDFFNRAAPVGPLVRAKDRKILGGGKGVQMELLAWGNIVMEPHLFRVAPGAGSKEPYSHEGEEFLFIVRGRLTIRLEEKEFHLRSGDSFYFRSKSPHSWINPGNSQTTILWINTPPTF